MTYTITYTHATADQWRNYTWDHQRTVLDETVEADSPEQAVEIAVDNMVDAVDPFDYYEVITDGEMILVYESHELVEVLFDFEAEEELRYFPDDSITADRIFWDAKPYCMIWSEVERLSREWETDLFTVMHEASEAELRTFGTELQD